jgi:hypothetical protein
MRQAAVTRRLVLRDGRLAVLRRLSGVGPAQTAIDVDVLAVVRGFKPEQLVAEAGLQQGDRVATITDHEIAAASWPGPPRKGDRLVLAGVTTTVQSVESRYLGEAVDRHVMVVRG